MAALLCATIGATLCLAQTAPNELAAAKVAYERAQYERARKLVLHAIDAGLGDADAVQTYLLLVEIEIVLDHPQQATAAFAEVLRRRPDYQPGPKASPKIWEVFRAAQAARASEKPASPAVVVPPRPTLEGSGTDSGGSSSIAAEAPPAAESSSWWIWTAVGAGTAAVLAVVVSAYVSANPKPPTGDFGPVRLP